MAKKPILLMPLNTFVVIKAKKVKVVKKKAVKKPVKKVKVEVPVRPSPLNLGDKVWYYAGSDNYVLGTIVKIGAWDPKIRTYFYTIEGLTPTVAEENIIPASCFPLIASDVTKMKPVRNLQDILNEMFDAEAKILAAYRKGQKRPWAYYILPDPKVLWEVVKWQDKAGTWVADRAVTILKPHAGHNRFMPVSSAPQELLSYLGIHVYGRRWVRHGVYQEPEQDN